MQQIRQYKVNEGPMLHRTGTANTQKPRMYSPPTCGQHWGGGYKKGVVTRSVFIVKYRTRL